MRTAIVNVAVGGNYPRGQDRLAKSMREHAPAADLRLWRDHVPIGSPSHHQMPYGFKAHALRAAAETHDTLLWLDASMWALRTIQPILDHIEAHGVAVWLAGWSVGQWTTDSALRHLHLTRDEAMAIPLCAGGIFGVCLKHQTGRAFLDQFWAYATDGVTFHGPWKNESGNCSADARCLGHRHDMPALSVLAQRLGVQPIHPPKWWGYDANPPETNREETLVVCRGM